MMKLTEALKQGFIYMLRYRKVDSAIVLVFLCVTAYFLTYVGTS